MRKFIIEFH